MPSNQEDFGQYLRNLRESSGLKQPELAKEIGTTKQNISNWERRQPHSASGAVAKPSPEFAVKIAHFFKRPVEEVLVKAGIIPESGDKGNVTAKETSEGQRDVVSSWDTDSVPGQRKERVVRIADEIQYLDDTAQEAADTLLDVLESVIQKSKRRALKSTP